MRQNGGITLRSGPISVDGPGKRGIPQVQKKLSERQNEEVEEGEEEEVKGFSDEDINMIFRVCRISVDDFQIVSSDSK